ncbi:NAD(P)-dependent alcohol dehydrogenase [Capillibacterium thermochitinicola]|uniref:NAD(P)-dependent alcohol dehydrogenase n=1 Tax=Capillibacterium thermochitinicola TaxID=2699427 RepID=A0A8J6HZD7_9FIRM|nr:NAD(P)-dependent alcohol dehydrogenase [Capillibacterium thermochitinicola]MBA2132158.1 NAD(P)-dependent alcohol dehydrogenase [Capillibacterium thermochitinicola]
MKAALMTEPGKLSIVEREMPQIKENEVLVKIEHVGVCGSDLHYYEYGRIGNFVVEKPIVLGHEAAGRVVETGKNVKTLRKGDLVALEPGITCGKCEFCKTGRYNLCPDVEFLATPPYDGAFVEYIAYPEDMCFKLPPEMDTMEGALIEPLAVGFHTANQANAQIGESAVILGAGCIGLVILMSLLARGLREVYITDIIDLRLKKAEEIGAKKCINARESKVVEEIMKLTDNKGVDIVIDAAGSKITTQQTVDLVKRGGRIILVGMAANPVIEYDFGKLQAKEAVLNTVFRYRNIYPAAIKAVGEKMIDVKQIVTDVFGFSEIKKALEYNIVNKEKTVKVVIDMNK